MWEHQNLRLYVGGLPYQTTSEDLADLFSQIGQVISATVITDRDSGRSKGFGFVEMSNDQESRDAIDQLNGSRLGERTIIVNEARERQQSGGNRYQSRDRRSGSRDRDGYRDRRY